MLIFKENIAKEEYDNYISKHKLSHILQSYNWAKIKNFWQGEHVGVYDENNNLVAASLILKRSVGKIFSFGYIPRGIVIDYSDKKLVKFYLESLKKFAKKNNLIFIKFDPALVYRTNKLKEFKDTKENSYAKEVISFLKECGLVHHGFTKKMNETIQPRYDATTYLQEDLFSLYSATCRKT